MKTLTTLVGLGVAMAVGALGPAQAAAVEPYEQAAFDAAQKSGEPVLIFVEAPWCPTCAKERPILQHLTPCGIRASSGLRRRFRYQQATSAQLGVQMQSTLIVYHGAKETGRMTGATDPAVMKRLLETSVS